MEREKRTLGKRLRKNLRKLFTKPFKKKAPIEIDPGELEDLAQFTGLDPEQVLPYVRREKGRRLSNEFDWVDPRTAGEYGWFYRGSRVYLFNADAAWDLAVSQVQPGMRVLDFGGGAGRNTLAFAAKGADAHYVDVGVLSAQFTAFRARKRGLKVTVIDPLVEVDGAWVIDSAEAARRVGGFDLVVCDNVLEHVPNYHVAVQKLAAGLSPQGRILELTPFKRAKTYVFKSAPEWDIHLEPTMSMEEAMAQAGMRPVPGEVGGLWERASG